MSQKRSLDWLGKTGAIVNIFVSFIIVVFCLLSFIGSLMLIAEGDSTYIGIASLVMVILILATMNLVFSSLLLGGSLKYKTVTIIFSFITLSVLGAVFLLCSNEVNYQNKKNDENNFSNLADSLSNYKSLLDSGAITEEEYNQIKKQLIEGSN